MDKQRELRFCNKINELKNAMYAVAIGLLGNKDDAEDAIQNAVFSAYRCYDSLSAFEKFKPWLLKILTMECYKILNKRKREKEFFSYSEDELPAEDPYEKLDKAASVWEAICTLEESYRIPVILFYYENMPVRDISKTLDITPDAVKKRLQRARALLKTILKEADFQ